MKSLIVRRRWSCREFDYWRPSMMMIHFFTGHQHQPLLLLSLHLHCQTTPVQCRLWSSGDQETTTEWSPVRCSRSHLSRHLHTTPGCPGPSLPSHLQHRDITSYQHPGLGLQLTNTRLLDCEGEDFNSIHSSISMFCIILFHSFRHNIYFIWIAMRISSSLVDSLIAKNKELII